MRTFVVLILLMVPISAARADLGDAETSLGEISFDEVQVSPDGGRLAFITRRNDFEHDREAFALWMLDLSRNAAPVRLAESGAYSALRWSPDGRLLSFLAAADDEAAQLFVLEPAAGKTPRRLTDPDRFADGIDFYDWLPDGSGLMLVASEPPVEAPEARQKRREFYGDVRRFPGPAAKSSIFKVALADGRAERVAESPFEMATAFAVSGDGWRLAVAGSKRTETIESSEVLLLPLGPQAVGPQQTRNSIWEETLAWAGSTLFAAGPGEENGVYTNTEGRLYRVEENGRVVRISPGLEGYVKQVLPLGDGSLLVTANGSTHMRVSRVEPGSGSARTLLDQRGWVFNLSASRDGGTTAFVSSDPRHFPEIYVAQGVEGLAKARPVTELNAAFTREPLPEIETVSWEDGEGGTVEGVLYWPPGRRGEKGLPLIVDLHGGPMSVARTESVSLQASFLSFPTVLAARGFLVLNPNYRGSAGRGDAFSQGIEGRRCSRPSEDVIRGVENLVARGWADRRRLGLMGYSGGGGLSKCLLGRTDLFRAVSSGSGSWNDILLYTSRRGLMWSQSFFKSTSPWADFDLWWRESPLSGLEKIKTPTLLISGERDGDSPRHADELYRALVARGVPVESLVFPGEGHVFSKPSHKRTKMRAEISWFEHYLLGRPRAELP
ncbi:MAG TPA: prolyl oligopeptidase family serine peptidase [Thermoanaerobaculia bacterium]|jgi:dipeptidyl aminopeptidase/acylaminoacyl peptidase|nr:prolyl oligopeptidase family serine peptidase [Thermoanaerobaculia bacterium]